MRFSETITVGSPLDFESRIAKANFGDGYEQRQLDGLNTDRQKWQLNFQNITDAKLARIIGFLRTVGPITAFIWAPPAPHPTRMFVAEFPFHHEPGKFDNHNFMVTFREDFNPTDVDQCGDPTITPGSPSGTVVPVTLAITTPGGAQLMVTYTSDGTEPLDPTENYGTLWTPAVQSSHVWHTGDRLKVIAIHDDYLPSDVVADTL